MSSGDRQLGQTLVLYPGHPLVGRVVPVVRRYGQRERGQWVTELPDGSRQYIPISWCSPLSSSEETLPVPPSSQDDPPSEGTAPSPLSLSALRDLAALVRQLQEEATQRGEEQHDAERRPGEDGQQEHPTRRGQPGTTERETGVADMGELPGGGSAPTGAHDPANGTPPGGVAPNQRPAKEVKES